MHNKDIKQLIYDAPIILILGMKFIAIPGVVCMMIIPFSSEAYWSAILTVFLYSIPVFWFGGIYYWFRCVFRSTEVGK